MKNALKGETRARTEKERLQQGRSQLKELSPKQLGHYEPSSKRDILSTLKAAEADRIAKLLPEKYKRMSANPFAFFRGSVCIMAKDLADHPRTRLMVQLCGDAHLQNLGWFAAPDGRIVFDINDFDETIMGPWEWDVKRMVTSIVLAGRVAQQSDAVCGNSAELFVRSYCEKIAQLAAEPTLVAARYVVHKLNQSEPINAAWQQAEREKPTDLLKRYAVKVKGEYRFRNVADEWPLSEPDRKRVLASLKAYVQTLAPEHAHFMGFYRPVDVAFKIVGTGSVGLRDYVVLMQGRDPDDALFIQVKQEVDSTYAPFLKSKFPDNQGQRVAEGQRRIQPVSDLLLGWTRIGNYDFLVRQLNDHKGTLDLSALKPDGLESLGLVAGELLARGHSRSGDPLAIHGYIGDGTKVVNAFAKRGMAYAEQVYADFNQFERAVKAGQIKVAPEKGKPAGT